MYLPRSILSALESAVNKSLSASVASKKTVLSLNNKVIEVFVSGFEFSITLLFVDGVVRLSSLFDGDSDLKISGTPSEYIAFIRNVDKAYESNLAITGDSDVARNLKALFSDIEIDLEEQLAPLLGGTVSHQIGRAHRTVTRAFVDRLNNFEQEVSDYLKIESKAIISRNELDRFLEKVDCTRDDVDRLEARALSLRSCRQLVG